jgi:hypothetical protein
MIPCHRCHVPQMHEAMALLSTTPRRVRRGQGGDKRDGVGEGVETDAAHGGVVEGWWDEMGTRWVRVAD